MAFKKGLSGNPAGRRPGSGNKVTTLTKDQITEFLTAQWPTFRHDFNSMEPKARIQHFIKLLSFVIPQPKQTDLNIDIARLSDEQLDELVTRILQ